VTSTNSEAGGVAQREIVEALMNPEAYGGEAAGMVELKQTHISFVFLTRDYVYKVKKAVNFGFLDFSTLEKRRFYCEKEVELNKRLCGDMYVAVVPITKSDGVRVGGEGKVVEYAVKMKRIPEERIMDRLLEEGKVDAELMDRLAKIIAKFHLKAKTGNEVDEYGSLQTIETNWRENFEQTEAFVGETISKQSYDFIRMKVREFMQKNRELFERRVADKRIRECHGDIHSGNIFAADRIYIFDAIEFNERFRNCDVASEVAFLAMDLDAKGRGDLSDRFVAKYVEYSGDRVLKRLLPFYKCYRAYVRGKVTSFKYADPNVNPKEKTEARHEADGYFRLAAKYAEQL